jgi:cation diffusion facilitator CzcD-associated flavoprotein CzcO
LLSRYPELVERLYDFYMEWYSVAFGNATVGDEREKELFRVACEANLARISDPDLRTKLTPPYPVMCKRLVLGDGYYEAFMSGKAALVTEPIARIEREGIRTSDNKLHVLDVLVLATGFKTHEYCRRLNISVAGGPSLEEAWKDGAATLDSVAVAGIPNFFILGGPYSTIGNLSTMTCTEYQVRYILELIREMCERGARSIAARPAAQNAFVKEMQEGASKTVWLEGCKSWYLDSNGRVDIWTKSAYAFVDKMVAGPEKRNYSFQ